MPTTPLLDLAKETKYVADAAVVPQRGLSFEHEGAGENITNPDCEM